MEIRAFYSMHRFSKTHLIYYFILFLATSVFFDLSILSLVVLAYQFCQENKFYRNYCKNHKFYIYYTQNNDFEYD